MPGLEVKGAGHDGCYLDVRAAVHIYLFHIIGRCFEDWEGCDIFLSGAGGGCRLRDETQEV